MARILLVDDDPQIVKLMKLALEADQHSVSVAGSGEQALERCRNQNYDLLVTDILMPDMDGIELIRVLSNEGKSLPVIAISGGRRKISAEFNLKSADLMGACMQLKKPFSMSELRSTIEKVLKQSH